MISKLKKVGMKVKVAQPTWTVGVIDRSYTEQTREPHGTERYSYRGETSTSHSVEGIRLIKEGEYGHDCNEMIHIGFEPKYDETYHLLYAVYSTGDSFGHDHAKCLEAIGLYQDRKIAEANEKILKEAKKLDGSKLLKLSEEGTIKPYGYFPPWFGYFESLGYIEVLAVMLK